MDRNARREDLMRKQYCALGGLLLLFLNAEAAPLNLGGSMDLGDPGKPVPGWGVRVMRMDRVRALSNREKTFFTKTVEGRNGFALQTPEGRELQQFQLVGERLRIERDGEVEISFDFRCSPDADGKLHLSFDFRALGDRGIKPRPEWKHPRYPVLEGIGVTPAAAWKTVRKTVRVLKWHNDYTCSFVVSARNGGEIPGTVEIDNFRIRFLSDPENSLEEGAAIPERPGSVYRKGEMIPLKLNVLLNSGAKTEDLVLSVVSDQNESIHWEYPVVLHRRGFRYEGSLNIPADQYGSFCFKLFRGKKEIPVLGNFSVVHAPVHHPRGTPGWGIGYNQSGLAVRSEVDRQYDSITILSYPSFRSRFEIPYLAGMRMNRIWGKWRQIEPRQGVFRPELVDPLLEESARLGMESVFCLAGGNLLAHDPPGDLKRGHFPVDFGKWLKPVPNRKNLWILDTENSIWDPYLDFCLKRWGGQVRIWEFLNEPGAGECPPELYIRYLKHVYRRIKAFHPEYLVLGNGNTCDVGFNQGWCALLSKTDPDYVDFMDGAAFHPYWNSSDFCNGIYGLFSTHIHQLRASMKKPLPLWNTECYYITNARNIQNNFYVNLEYCEADAVQRHYLDGMLNGVFAALPLTESSFLNEHPPVNGAPALSTMAVAMNALSAQLEGMERLEPIRLNSYMRAGIFTGKNGKALGVVYDLRPAGSIFRLPEQSALKVFDLFGNPVTDKEIFQSYAPHYLHGSREDLRNFFRSVRFMPRNSCNLFVKPAGERVFFNAVNLSGQAGRVTADFQKESGLPSIQFAFASAEDDSCAELPGPGKIPSSLPYCLRIGSESVGNGNATVLPAVPLYDLGADTAGRRLSLGRNASIAVWMEKDLIHFAADVTDPDLCPAANDELWNGDSIEFFIDPMPFRKMNNNQILSSTPLDCFQYVFAAVPSKTGHSIRMIARARSQWISNAAGKQSRTANGYRLEGEIPIQEFRRFGSRYFGMEIRVNRAGVDRLPPPAQETLSGKSEHHFRYRLHYPVFRLDDAALRILDGPIHPRNTDFRKGRFGEADFWGFSFQDRNNRMEFVPDGGIFSNPVLILNSSKPFARIKAFGAVQDLQLPETFRGMKLSALVRLSGITPVNPQPRRHGPEGFCLQIGPYDFGSTVLSGMPGSCGWTRIECWIPFQRKIRHADLTVGLRNATGKVEIS